MQVTSATNGSPSPSTSLGQQSVALGKEAFLELLLAQLRNQDPLKPIDSTQYVSQLAMLSNLEQTVQHNEKLGSLVMTNMLTQAASIVGQTVESSDGTVKGTVVGARVTNDGVIAELADGKSLLMSSGVRVSPK